MMNACGFMMSGREGDLESRGGEQGASGVESRENRRK